MAAFKAKFKLDDFARVFILYVAVYAGFHIAFISFVGVGELVTVIYQGGCFGAVGSII